MSEADEVTSTLSRHLAAMASAAMGVAQLAQQRRAQRARQAQHQSDETRAATAGQLHAERELAAAQWAQAGDPRWAAAQPEHVAQAWASAAAWEPFDERAGRARQKFEDMLRGWGADPQVAAEHVERGDREALALMLNRAAQDNTRAAADGPSEHRQHGQAPGAQSTPGDAGAAAAAATRAPSRGSVYSGGAEPPQLAGKSYPHTPGQALAQTTASRPDTARRETSQRRETERGRDR